MTLVSQSYANGASDLPILRRLQPKGGAARDLQKHRYQAGEFLCNAGEQIERLHVIEKGIVELCRYEGNSECAVLLLVGGDLMSATAGLFNEPCLTSARALTPVWTVSAPCAAVRAEAQVNPQLTMDLSRAIGGQWRMAVRHILDLKCRSAPQRLASILLRIADEGQENGTVDLPFSKGALAARIGVSRETLSRAIQSVAEHGVLLRGRRIVIRDRDAAERFCAPSPYPGLDEHSLDVHAL